MHITVSDISRDPPASSSAAGREHAIDRLPDGVGTNGVFTEGSRRFSQKGYISLLVRLPDGVGTNGVGTKGVFTEGLYFALSAHALPHSAMFCRLEAVRL